MREYTTIEHYVNHVIGEITKRDVEQVSEKLRALGWEEVVRCRDCVHYKPYRTHKHGMMNRCYDENGHTHRRDENDFCSRGERRTNDN